MSRSFDPQGGVKNNDYWYNFGHNALELSIESYAFDGRKHGTYGLQNSHLVLDDVDWQRLHIRGEVEVPPGLDDHVFEPDANVSDVGKLMILGDCVATHNRFVAAHVSSFDGSGNFDFDIHIDYDDVTDQFELRPVLVRDGPPKKEDYRYGQVPGLRLAEGSSFDVTSEDEEDRESFLPIETKPFEESRSDQVFYLDHSVADNPRLYINSNVDLLSTALKTKAPYGSKRWTKETLERLIGHPAWVELVVWAASDISEGECSYKWQEDVVAMVAAVRGESYEVVAERLEELVSEPDKTEIMLEEINEDVQKILEVYDPLENLLEEVM